MSKFLDPFRLLLISLAGWMNQCQRNAIESLREENRVLREQLGGKRLRFTGDQRRRLAAKAKELGSQLLAAVVTIVAGGVRPVQHWHVYCVNGSFRGTPSGTFRPHIRAIRDPSR